MQTESLIKESEMRVREQALPQLVPTLLALNAQGIAAESAVTERGPLAAAAGGVLIQLLCVRICICRCSSRVVVRQVHRKAVDASEEVLHLAELDQPTEVEQLTE